MGNLESLGASMDAGACCVGDRQSAGREEKRRQKNQRKQMERTELLRRSDSYARGKANDLFKRLDRRNKGSVRLTDFMKALRTDESVAEDFGLPAKLTCDSKDKALKVFNAMDSDSDKQFGLEEFETYVLLSVNMFRGADLSFPSHLFCSSIVSDFRKLHENGFKIVIISNGGDIGLAKKHDSIINAVKKKTKR